MTDRNKNRVADDVKVFAPSIKMAVPNGVCFSKDGHLFLITRAEAVAPIIMKFLEQERQRAVMHPRPAART